MIAKSLRFKRWRILLSLFILFLICGGVFVFYRAKTNRGSPVSLEEGSFFVQVPLSKYSSIDAPCLTVQIEDQPFLLELDLGLGGDCALTKEALDLLPSKKFLRTKTTYGVRGKGYETNLYQIQKMKIGQVAFLSPILQVASKDFLKDATFIQEGGEISSRESGRLGWKIFYNTNLLIDVKGNKIAFCNSLEELKKHGYLNEDFFKTPLFIERGFVELEARTLVGSLRCMLDTGATWNMLNVETDRSIEEVLWDPEKIMRYTSFQINEKDLGPMTFHCAPLKAPISIEAILGMEFFREHLVFIDFSKGFIYISKNAEGLYEKQRTEAD